MAHILLIEDDQWTADCYRDWLRPEHTIANALNAQQALDAADKKTPDVILLDLLLPYANGTQFLHTLQSHADLAHIPVVLCSSSLPTDMPDLRAYGVRAMLDKGTVTPKILRQTVGEALHHAAI